MGHKICDRHADCGSAAEILAMRRNISRYPRYATELRRIVLQSQCFDVEKSRKEESRGG